MSEISFDKSIALIEEFETSHKLLQLGFGELQNINTGMISIFYPFNCCHKALKDYSKHIYVLAIFGAIISFQITKH